jgi:hypothetical protein
MTLKAVNAYTLSVPPRLGQTALHEAIRALDGRYGQVDVLAASLRFATPLDLCALRALVDYAAGCADLVDFECPSLVEVQNYLGRMNFYADLPPNVVLSRDPPALRRNDRSTRLVELCRVESCDDVQQLEERVWQVAQSHFGKGPMAKACVSVIAAASENVLDHATSPIGALVAAQRYERTGLEVAIVDLGVGIPNRLREKPEFDHLTDIDAVENALRDGVTSTGEVGRGAGLAELIAAAERAGRSTLVIQSGQAHFTVSCREGANDIYRTRPEIPVPGTWISLRLHP